MNDVIVDSFNGLMSGNVKSGSVKPVSCAMISTNYDGKSETRYCMRIYFQNVVKCCINRMLGHQRVSTLYMGCLVTRCVYVDDFSELSHGLF